MGLANWFSTFYSNIQVQNGDTISKRYKAITKRLNTDFWGTDSETSHSLQVGSYGRNTAIDGTSDVDMIFRLPDSIYQQYNNYSGNGQSALLQVVRTSVRRTYSSTQIGADGQVIEIPFSDGITFELVRDSSTRMTATPILIPTTEGAGRKRIRSRRSRRFACAINRATITSSGSAE